MNVAENVNREINILEAVRRQSVRWSLPENAQRPCLMLLLETDIAEGFRNESFHILACDLLNRQKKSVDSVIKLLLAMNKRMKAPLFENEIKRIINSASKSGHTYGCNNNSIILNNCIGKDVCSYFKQGYKRGNRSKEGLHALVNRGWLNRLGGNEVKTYLALCKLEKEKRIQPGNVLIVTHRDVARVAGIARQTVAEKLKELSFNHLIMYKKGKRHKWNHIASEIVRTLPIPEVSDVKESACPVLENTPLCKSSQVEEEQDANDLGRNNE